MLIKFVSLLFFTALSALSIYSQTEAELNESQKLIYEAVQKMDAGKVDASMELLKQAKKLDPRGMTAIYEMGYAYTLKNDYGKAIKYFKSITNHKEVNDRVFVMLGNCYDINGQPEEAVKAYEKGLNKFPNSGRLHLERGNMFLQKEEYNDALFYYEKGIEVEPNFSSNYYRAANIYFMSNQKIWAMMYAELHVLISPNSERSLELREKLYDCYVDNIHFDSDTSARIDFCENTISLDNSIGKAEIIMPYCMSWGTAMSLSVFPEAAPLNVEKIATVRDRFIDNYYTMGYNESHPNILYEYRKNIQEKGLNDAYNYYILLKGDPDFVKAYFNEHEDELEKLANYLNENPIALSPDSKLYRKQYPGE